MGQKVTIRRISELTGLSKSTVGRVTTSHPSVSPETARRVREAIAELNHDQQPPARRSRQGEPAVSSQKPLTAYALVVPDVRSNFYSSLIQGFDAGAGAGGHQVITCNTENDALKQADIIMHLMDKRVAGVAINPASGLQPPVHQLRLLQSSGVPVVQLHRGIDEVLAPLIRLPYRSVVTLAARKIVEFGHRRIALFLGCRTPEAEVYEEGFRSAIDDIIPGLSEQLWVHYSNSEEFSIYERELEIALEGLFQLPNARRPTAIFVPWDPSAEAIYLMLIKAGYSIPKDISLVSEGDSWRVHAMGRRLSAVTLNESHTGHLAATLLTEMSTGQRPMQSKQKLTIPIGWHAGETIGPAPTM